MYYAQLRAFIGKTRWNNIVSERLLLEIPGTKCTKHVALKKH